MIRALPLLLLLSLAQPTSAQRIALSDLGDHPVFTSLEKALALPDSVYRLRLKGKWKEVPAEVFTAFPHLAELDISGNKLKALPAAIGNLTSLVRLNAERNKIEALPAEIGNLSALEELVLNRNELSALPESIGNLQKLRRIDLWSNNLDELPHTMKGMAALKELDLRVIVMSDEQKEEIRKLLPDAKVFMDKGCNCGN